MMVCHSILSSAWTSSPTSHPFGGPGFPVVTVQPGGGDEATDVSALDGVQACLRHLSSAREGIVLWPRRELRFLSCHRQVRFCLGPLQIALRGMRQAKHGVRLGDDARSGRGGDATKTRGAQLRPK